MSYIIESVWNFASQLKWLDKYLDGHDGFIAGGAFKSIFSGQKIKDLDMFFRSEKDFGAAIKFFTECDDYIRWYQSDNVIAFKHNKSGIVVECVKKIFGSPKQIISQFDFTITKFAYYKYCDNETDKTYVSETIYCDKFFEHLNLKRLVTDDKIMYPIDTFHRLFKYGKRGYFPCRQTKIDIMLAIRRPEIRDEDISSIFFYLADGID